MPYIGQQPTTGAFLELDSLTASATADYTLQLNGANYEPESVNNLLVSINGVIQGSNTMSLSGSTLTVGATLSSSDVIDFVRVFGNVGTISTPTDGSVTTNKIGTGAVTNAKIADSTLDLTSKVTGILPVANGGTGVSSIPKFRVKQSSDQSIANASGITVQFNDKTASGAFDIGGYFNTTNYRYVPLVAGYYFFASTVTIKSATPDYVIIFIRKNGATIYRNLGMESNAANAHVPAHVSGIIYMNGSTDYIDVQVQHNVGSNANTNSNFEYSNFNGYFIGA
jgi:hypothetical protein